MNRIPEDAKQDINPVWNRGQDDYLADLIKTYGDANWHIIADYMGKRYKYTEFSDKDCHDRWQLFLSRNEKKQLWTNRERYLLLIAHKKHKNRWSEIARMLHKTSRNLIKNRFYTLFRKITNRVKNNDIYINSLLDLLEIYYVLQLVEQYFDIPRANITEEKNYAHKLVQRMDKQKVTDYISRVTALYSKKGTISDLFRECGQLYAENIAVESGAMDCNEIAIDDNEEEGKIILPFPKDFNKERMISNEEKNDFWICAFHNKETKSAQIPYSADNSANSSFFSQVQSAGSVAMREDEGFGFSQFINPYEGYESGDKKFYDQLYHPSASSPNNQLSSLFQNNSGVQKPADRAVAAALRSVHSPSAFMPFNGVQEKLHSQSIHLVSQP